MCTFGSKHAAYALHSPTWVSVKAAQRVSPNWLGCIHKLEQSLVTFSPLSSAFFSNGPASSIAACIGRLTKQGQVLKTCKEDSEYYCYDAECIMLQKSVCWIVQFNQFKVFFLLTFFLLCHSRLTGINWFMNKWAGFLCLVNIVLLCKFSAFLSSPLQLYARGHILKIHMERDNARTTQIR